MGRRKGAEGGAQGHQDEGGGGVIKARPRSLARAAQGPGVPFWGAGVPFQVAAPPSSSAPSFAAQTPVGSRLAGRAAGSTGKSTRLQAGLGEGEVESREITGPGASGVC